MSKMKKLSKKQVYLLAQTLGIKVSQRVNVAKPVFKFRNKTKDQLIREIQVAEHNEPCYKTDVLCNMTNCSWHAECQKSNKK